MKATAIRESFLDFFAQRGHTRVPSAPVLIKDDPTLLFTNAGMNQFKGVFLGTESRPFKRATSSQKCFRVSGKHNDLEQVGQTTRHHTFFEMLGNFSFGDYFKDDAIAYGWEWVTKVLGLPKDRLYVSVFRDDDEAFAIWRKIDPALAGRVLRFGEQDNYWSMGEVGPCGPCSEIHFDRGEEYSCGKPECTVNCECDRYLELWNLVFMQFSRNAEGQITPLPKPSVDTGGGLERFASVLQNTPSNYETDLFLPLISEVAKISGVAYDPGPIGLSHRVSADHIRALGFAIADGGLPANEGAGYVLRRILRRAARHGKLLGIEEPFLHKLVSPLVLMMGEVYPELIARQEHIVTVIRLEEERFAETLDAGLSQFAKLQVQAKKNGVTTIPGDEVFKLFDTYGFPLDLTEVMARDEGLTVDIAGYQKALAEQRLRSRRASKFTADLTVPEECREAGPTEFVYDTDEIKTTVRWVAEDRTMLVLDQTPFYVESGGQVDDHGLIENENMRFIVESMERRGETIFHRGKFAKGDRDNFCGQPVTARIDIARRRKIIRNHTATHLLHRALRDVLGDHVHQSGSLVDPDRLRFDFSHGQPLEPEELARIEAQVNEHILANVSVQVEHTTHDQAVKDGAIALFGEKYAEQVRVVKVPGISAELCGGTHVSSTGEIGQLRIVTETGVAAGVRRIEAITGEQAYQQARANEATVSQAAELLGTASDKVTSRLAERLEMIRRLQSENKNLRKRLMENQASGSKSIILKTIKGDIEVVYEKFDEYTADDLRAEGDKWRKSKVPTVALVAASEMGMITSATSDSGIALGIHSGRLMKKVAGWFGGGGGGKPSYAEGKAKDLSRWDEEKKRFLDIVKDMVEEK